MFLLITLFCTQKTAQTRFVFKNAGCKKSKTMGERRKVRYHMVVMDLVMNSVMVLVVDLMMDLMVTWWSA